MFKEDVLKGGPGSGNFGHSGRPGKVGGSGGSAITALGNLYHYTSNANAIAISANGFKLSDGIYGKGIYLTPDEDSTSTQRGGDARLLVDVNASSTFVGKLSDIWEFDDAAERAGFDDVTAYMKTIGYDSIVVNFKNKLPYVVVFDPKDVTVVEQQSVEQKEHIVNKGGPGSGNFGHSGRPGKIGGSTGGGGSGKVADALKRNRILYGVAPALAQEDADRLAEQIGYAISENIRANPLDGDGKIRINVPMQGMGQIESRDAKKLLQNFVNNRTSAPLAKDKRLVIGRDNVEITLSYKVDRR